MVMSHNNCENCIQILEALYVSYLVKKVKETGILIDKPNRVRGKPKTVRTPENIAAVAESVCEAPST